MSETKKDWRVGLTVKPKYRTHPLYYEMAAVVEVHPSGTGGVVDPDGVLRILLLSGKTTLVPAGEWVTA